MRPGRYRWASRIVFGIPNLIHTPTVTTRTKLLIAGAVALLLVSPCACCVVTGALGAPGAAEREAHERQLIDAARAACATPRTFRLREGGLSSRSSDYECVGPEVIAAEEQARIAEAQARVAAATAPPPTTSTTTDIPTTVPTTTASDEPTAEPEREPEDTAHGLGEEFSMGNGAGYSYRFEHLRLRRRVGNSLMGVAAPEGATYLVVEFRERNDGDDVQHSAGSVVVSIRDANGRRYVADEDAMRRAMLSGDDIEQVGDQMMPGVWTHREVIFQIPRESADDDIEVVLDARGAFSGGGLVRARPR